MSDSFSSAKKLMIFGLLLPLAVLIGYLMATPDSFSTVGFLGLLICVLLCPLFLRWHHSMLVLVWNAAFLVFFLPGQPQLWIVCVILSFVMAFLERGLSRQ